VVAPRGENTCQLPAAGFKVNWTRPAACWSRPADGCRPVPPKGSAALAPELHSSYRTSAGRWERR